MRADQSPWLAMARNNAWANATLYSALSVVSDDVFAAPRPGFFGSLAATMNHIYDVDRYYIDALVGGGEGRRVFDRTPAWTVADLARLQAASDARLVTYCIGLTDAHLASTCVTERHDGPARENVAATLLHLFQHQVHHRGQAHVQLSDAGFHPPQLDDFFLEYGRVDSAASHWT